MNESLWNAALRQLGMNPSSLTAEDKVTLSDICYHSISGGFHGFTSYAETTSFYDENKDQIIQHALHMADDRGMHLPDYIAGFNCLDVTPNEVCEFLLLPGKSEHEDQIKNGLSWDIAEQVATDIIDV